MKMELASLNEKGLSGAVFYSEKILTFSEMRANFCVLLVSLPNVYPAQKQVMPKLTTAMKAKILIG